MLRAYSVAAIEQAERELMATLPPGELMARAARGLADALGYVPPGDRVVMLIGPGNNGADALYAAVHVRARGVDVDVCVLDEQRVHHDALTAALAAGARRVEHPTDQRHCVDALFGIGARPGLIGKAARWAAWVERTRPLTVCVDVASGVGVDEATTDLPHMRGDLTVTLGAYKNALLAMPASAAHGQPIAHLVDIGLGPYLGQPSAESIEPSDGYLLGSACRWLSQTVSHKYTRGVVGVRAGSDEYAGAAHLCVAGAQSATAGMVRFVGSGPLAQRVVDRAPEVVAGVGRVQAWVVGPGMSPGPAAADHVDQALADAVPAVIDAGALSHLPDRCGSPVVLTPHAGELAALLGVQRAEIEAAPLRWAHHTAERWNATVLLKGTRTVVATPGLVPRINVAGSGWLGTAGSGDVLAGLIGSLLASGASAHDAASLGAFLHAEASVAANRGGPVKASDIAQHIPRTIAQFAAGTLGEGHTA